MALLCEFTGLLREFMALLCEYVALLCVDVTHKREREQVYSTQAVLKAKMSADDHEQTARRVRGKES